MSHIFTKFYLAGLFGRYQVHLAVDYLRCPACWEVWPATARGGWCPRCGGVL